MAVATREDFSGEGMMVVGVGAENLDGPGATEVRAAARKGTPVRTRLQVRQAGAVEDGEAEGAGWPDGVGDGRPFEVPFSVDYFQGFLLRAGVPSTALPGDGRTLSPKQAMDLLPHLLCTPR